MAFCSNCGTAMAAGAKFCTTCGSPITPLTAANRLKPFGVIMLVVAGFYCVLAVTRYNSAQYQFASMFGGGTDPGLAMQTLLGIIAGIVGIVLFTSEPRLFLHLNRNGLILFVILAALLPIFCWLPWLIPALKERQA